MNRLSETSPLAQALERNRARFNARFAAARQGRRDLEATSFGEVLVGLVEPIASAVAAERPDGVDRVVEVLYDLCLELLGSHLVGPDARPSLLGPLLTDLFPRIPSILADDPGVLIPSLANAAYNLSMEPAPIPDDWLAAMIRVIPVCETASEILDAGKVLAWRAGLAHFRSSAIATLRHLSERLQWAVLDLPEEWRDVGFEWLDLGLTDPWWRPGTAPRTRLNELALVGGVGGFRGFGGAFITPPEVIAVEGQLYAFDDERCWTVHADCFGATVRRFGNDLPKGAIDRDPGVSVSDSGLVTWDGLSARFDRLARPASFASNPHTLAVTVKRSHKVFLVAKNGGPA